MSKVKNIKERWLTEKGLYLTTDDIDTLKDDIKWLVDEVEMLRTERKDLIEEIEEGKGGTVRCWNCGNDITAF